MKLEDLKSTIEAQQRVAIGAINSSMGNRRADLQDRYYGELYGDEVEGRSQTVMTDVRDTIEGIKPELMDIFFGGDRVVEYTPRGSEDVEAAEQETETVNHVITQMNNGFEIFLAWFHDALLAKNGYIKRSWDEGETTNVEEYDNLDQEEILAVVANAMEDGEVDILKHWGGINEEGEQEPYGIKYKLTTQKQKYIVENVPYEELLVSAQWTNVHFDGCPFVAHRSTKPVSDLIEMGFNKKQVMDLPAYNDLTESEEKLSRRDTRFVSETDLGHTENDAMRPVLVYENYIRADLDGDGVAELLQVWTAGDQGEILKWKSGKNAVEEVGSIPFNALCPIPIPHKHYGLSVADLVDDLQRLRTVLTRQMVDNIVMGNNPDVVVDEDAASAETYEDLAITSTGRVIRAPGGLGTVQQLQPAQTAQQSLVGIEYVDGLREARTGVTRYNQGLDADSLNKTASGINQIITAAQKKMLLIARIFAETGVKRLFTDVHQDLRKGPMKKIAVRLRNEWVDVNPRMWATRADMTVNVGLGTGDRDTQFQRLGLILAEQKQALGTGYVGPVNVHHTLSKMCELAGFKDVEAFFPDPKNVEPPEQGPDPMQQIAEAEMEKAKAQAEAKKYELEIRKMEAETKRLDVLMGDDRERDLKAADIEAKEAERMAQPVDGQALAHG